MQSPTRAGCLSCFQTNARGWPKMSGNFRPKAFGASKIIVFFLRLLALGLGAIAHQLIFAHSDSHPVKTYGSGCTFRSFSQQITHAFRLELHVYWARMDVRYIFALDSVFSTTNLVSLEGKWHGMSGICICFCPDKKRVWSFRPRS